MFILVIPLTSLSEMYPFFLHFMENVIFDQAEPKRLSEQSKIGDFIFIGGNVQCSSLCIPNQ